MRRRVRQAFTLVELVIVIAIIGILAAIAIPRFIDIRSNAYLAQRDGIVASVRAGLLTTASKSQVIGGAATTFPPNLETTWNTIVGGVNPVPPKACSVDPCFELVIVGGYSDPNWQLTSDAGSATVNITKYDFTDPTGTNSKQYIYTQANGTFQ